MKRLIITSLSLLIAFTTFAQSGDAISTFLRKYSPECTLNWYGKKMPVYSFNAKLNSNMLKRKIVLLDYWATWCGACHSMGEDLNKKIIDSDFANNVQVIGVNNEGNMVKKNTDPVEYWKKNNMRYPMVSGKSVIKHCKAIKSSYPTLIIVDGQGTVRGRWDIYTPQVVNTAELIVWALDKQKTKFSQQDLYDNINQQNYYHALYICEQLKTSEYEIPTKLRCILHVAEGLGIDYAKPTYESARKTMSSKDFDDLQNNMLAAIVESKVQSIDMNRFGIQIAKEMCNTTPTYEEDYIFIDYLGRLYWRTNQKGKAKECAEKCLQLSKSNKAAPETIAYFESVLKSYQ